MITREGEGGVREMRLQGDDGAGVPVCRAPRRHRGRRLPPARYHFYTAGLPRNLLPPIRSVYHDFSLHPEYALPSSAPCYSVPFRGTN